jgi:hypothetical protein
MAHLGKYRHRWRRWQAGFAAWRQRRAEDAAARAAHSQRRERVDEETEISRALARTVLEKSSQANMANTSWLLGAFGECQVMAQPVAKRLFVSPSMIRGFRGCCLLLERGHHALASLNHQMWPRADPLYTGGEFRRLARARPVSCHRVLHTA